MKVLIIDDEKAARDLLVHYIKIYFPDILDIYTAEGIYAGKPIIQRENPDIIFLDIEMPTGNGMDLFDIIGNTNSSIVITSAFDEYAIQAIKQSVSDYLLKPIDIKEFIKSVSKIIEFKQEKFKSKVNQSKRIALHGQSEISYVNEDAIKYIISERAYTNIHLNDNNKYIVTKSLTHYENMLNNKLFFRLHRSYIINMSMISRVIKKNGGIVEMLDGKQFKIANQKRDLLLTKMNQL